jgi:hypothetical protein
LQAPPGEISERLFLAVVSVRRVAPQVRVAFAKFHCRSAANCTKFRYQTAHPNHRQRIDLHDIFVPGTAFSGRE